MTRAKGHSPTLSKDEESPRTGGIDLAQGLSTTYPNTRLWSLAVRADGKSRFVAAGAAGLKFGRSRPNAMKQPSASDPFTEVVTQPLVLDGQLAGLTLSLGHNLVFFTTEPDLATLDGGSFASLAQLTAQIRRVRAKRA